MDRARMLGEDKERRQTRAVELLEQTFRRFDAADKQMKATAILPAGFNSLRKPSNRRTAAGKSDPDTTERKD